MASGAEDNARVQEAMRKQREAKHRKAKGLCPRCGAKRLPTRELCGACTVAENARRPER